MRDFYISVDIETNGPTPGDYSMIAIGAVSVSDMQHSFSAYMLPIHTSWDEEAVSISGITRDWLMVHGEEPGSVMARFATWVRCITPHDARPVFVGFNASFDWMFVHWYMIHFLNTNPFGHSALDIKAYAMGALCLSSWKHTSLTQLPKELISERKLTHDALEDARVQAKIFSRIFYARDSLIPFDM